MSDKDKIREEIARINLYSRSEVLENILKFIDSMQKEPVSEDLEELKTVTDYADAYVGHPQEIDEDLSVYQKREAYKAGMNKAFDLIRAQGRKEVEK